MNWAVVSAVFAGIQTIISLAILLKLAFFAGKIVERVDQHENRLNRLEFKEE